MKAEIIVVAIFVIMLALTHNVTLGLLGVPPMGPYHTTEVTE
jgi:hypothetical protein